MIDREKRKREIQEEVKTAFFAGDTQTWKPRVFEVLIDKIVECEQNQETLIDELVDLRQDVHDLEQFQEKSINDLRKLKQDIHHLQCGRLGKVRRDDES